MQGQMSERGKHGTDSPRMLSIVRVLLSLTVMSVAVVAGSIGRTMLMNGQVLPFTWLAAVIIALAPLVSFILSFSIHHHRALKVAAWVCFGFWCVALVFFGMFIWVIAHSTHLG